MYVCMCVTVYLYQHLITNNTNKVTTPDGINKHVWESSQVFSGVSVSTRGMLL